MKRWLFAVLLGLLAAAGSAPAGWEPIRQPDTFRYRCTHATVYDSARDRFYMIGGSQSGFPGTNLNIVQRYVPDSLARPVSDSWELLAPMPTPRGWIGAAVVRGRVYVPGGYSNQSTSLDVNEAYDIAADSWLTCAPMPVRTLSYMICSYRDSLVYVCGGTDSGISGHIDSVLIYCPTTNTWTPGTRMPCATGSPVGGALLGDTLYVLRVGRPSILQRGYIHPDDPTRIDWHDGPMLPSYIKGAAVAVDGKVIFQGYHNAQSGDFILVYDPQTGLIDSMLSLPDSLRGGATGGNFLAGRTSPRPELYVLAGQRDSTFPTPYLKLDLSGEVGAEEAPDAPRIAPRVGPTIVRGVLRTGDRRPETGDRAELLDISGRKVMELRPGDNDVRHLARGVYFVRRQDSGESARLVLVE